MVEFQGKGRGWSTARAELLLHMWRTETSLGMMGWENIGESGACGRDVKLVATLSCCS